MVFELSDNFGPKVDRTGEDDAAESLFVREGIGSALDKNPVVRTGIASALGKNPWGDATSGGDSQPDKPEPPKEKLTGPELIKKVQEATKGPLEDALNVPRYEKQFVVGMQNGILAGDTDGFRYHLAELYKMMALQGRTPAESTNLVRQDLSAVEKILRQKCGVDINIDVTNDDRVILRIRPDTLALEISKTGDTVKRIEESGPVIILDNSKEVLRPTSAEYSRSISNRCLTTRSWS